MPGDRGVEGSTTLSEAGRSQGEGAPANLSEMLAGEIELLAPLGRQRGWHHRRRRRKEVSGQGRRDARDLRGRV